jgi:hypothetical protein
MTWTRRRWLTLCSGALSSSAAAAILGRGRPARAKVEPPSPPVERPVRLTRWIGHY